MGTTLEDRNRVAVLDVAKVYVTCERVGGEFGDPRTARDASGSPVESYPLGVAVPERKLN